jgi:TP901 family phage tail tape measure protein
MVFDILATDRASGVFDKVGGSATKAGRDVEAASGSMSKAMAATAAGVGLAGAAFAAVSVKMAADFQQSVTKLATTAGESTKNLKMVGDGMLTMAGQVGISANELAKGMYTVESSGIHGADALTVLKAAAQGAKQEQADLSKVTDAVTTALHDYNLPASDAAKVTSQMVTAVSFGKTTFDELTGSLHSVTPLAAALHVPFADIIGSLSAMTASGMSADQATQNMADALRHLAAPTQPMIKELAQLGITASDLSRDLGTKGLSGTMQEISAAILRQPGGAGVCGGFAEVGGHLGGPVGGVAADGRARGSRE